MDFSQVLRVSAARFPDRPAAVHRGTSWTFGELERAVNRLAAALLAAGTEKAPVASIVFNEPHALCLYLALARSGAVCVPINTRLHESEKAFIIDNSGAETLVVDTACLEEAERLLERCPSLKQLVLVNESATSQSSWPRLEGLIESSSDDDVCLPIDESQIATIMYTSGTTGFPKGVSRTHRANLAAVTNCLIGLPRFPSDVDLFCFPIFGVAYLFHATPALLSGATLVLDHSFDPARAWQLIEQHRATTTSVAPTMLASMLAVEGHERYDASSLRYIGVAYEFPRKLREAALKRFGNIFINQYGLTESQLCCARIGEFADDPSSVGKPMGLARIKLVHESGRPAARGEVGEIAFESPATMSEYHALPEETAKTIKDGWVYTGDLGRIDENGNLHFAGRSKEIIKTGGYSVDPVEVENVILDLDGVREASVVGVVDEHWGETVVAVVVRTCDASPTDSDLLAHCKARLTAYKVPKRVVFVTDLPKNATGKIERGRLRADLARDG